MSNLIVSQYPMGALSFRFDDPPPRWPFKYDKCNLGTFDPREYKKIEGDFLTGLSQCLGIHPLCILRPNGFNVIPDDGYNLKTIVKNVVDEVKKLVGEKLEVKSEIPSLKL